MLETWIAGIVLFIIIIGAIAGLALITKSTRCSPEGIGRIERKGIKLKDKLISITVVTGDETGIWNIGELEYSRTQFCTEWLEANPSNRNRLAQFLYWLAAACQQSQPPFGQQMIK